MRSKGNYDGHVPTPGPQGPAMHSMCYIVFAIARTSIIPLSLLCFLFSVIYGFDINAMWKPWNTATFAAVAVDGLKVVNLSESAWTVSNTALNISVPGSLPSVVCTLPYPVPLQIYKYEYINHIQGASRPLRCRCNTRSLFWPQRLQSPVGCGKQLDLLEYCLRTRSRC